MHLILSNLYVVLFKYYIGHPWKSAVCLYQPIFPCIFQTFLSTRRGSWVINRIADNGYPADMLHIRRFSQEVVKFLPRGFFNFMAENNLNKRFDHANFGLKPEHRYAIGNDIFKFVCPQRSGLVMIWFYKMGRTFFIL